MQRDEMTAMTSINQPQIGMRLLGEKQAVNSRQRCSITKITIGYS